MPSVLDITGKVFGSLTVIRRIENTKAGCARWACRCECGTEVLAVGNNLRAGTTKSCGKGHSKRDDLVGQTFGVLTVTKSLGVGRDFGGTNNCQVVECSCSCGGTWTGRSDSLKKGNTSSCGCIARGSKPFKDPTLAAFRRLLRTYKKHALQRELEWALSDDEFRTLIAKECFYCASPPCRVATSNKSTPKRARRTLSEITYNGVDRKDNSVGYVPDNVVTACSTCNYAKRELPAEDFLAHIRKIYDQHPGNT
jgi:hypothetical protein